MGAEYFETRAQGKSAGEAFKLAQDQAFYDHGHNGYTGSIAEKPGFVMVDRQPGETVAQCLERHDDSDIVNDKWGKAACIPGDSPDVWVFFGWASS